MDITLPPDFKDFLRLLNARQVEYLLIGGYAVGYHGYPRVTGDMDIWVDVNPTNAEKLVEVFREFGPPENQQEGMWTPKRFARPGELAII